MGKDVVRVQIVPFEKSDFESAADILSACIADPVRELAEYLENKDVMVLCAKKDGKLLGVLCLLVGIDTTDILDIAVAEESRCCGVGRALIEFAKERYPVLMLEVRESNAPARALYEKCGFEQISVRKNYYQSPTENAIIYRREQK